MMVKGIAPGPQVMTSNPQLFWGLIASMWVGNAMLLAWNLPLIGVWIRALTIPYRFVFPLVTLVCCVGVFSLARRPLDLYLTAGFAFLGYLFFKLSCEPAPLLLGFVLAPMMDENLRAALRLSHGDWGTLATRPLSSALLVAAALLVLMAALPAIRRQRAVAFSDRE